MELQKHTLLSVFFLFIVYYSATAQSKDTVYFDQYWSICEKPVAAYYRVTTLNRGTNVFYTGETTDYYITGEREMTGRYDKDGFKQDEFKFYNKNGKLVKDGAYINNDMKGVWNFYNENEKLKAQFDCLDQISFTPLFIVSNAGDTILNGNGKFAFKPGQDLPDIFPGKDYLIEGEIKDGKKEGVFKYYALKPEKKLLISETYKKGEQRGNGGSGARFPDLSLASKNLERIDNFYHTNIVFGYGKDGDQKVIDFLINKVPPEITYKSDSFEENTKPLYKIISSVLYANTEVPTVSNVFSEVVLSNDECYLLAFSAKAGDSASIPNITCDAIFTFDTSGYIIKSTFVGNLPKRDVQDINYYLSRLPQLPPYTHENERFLSNINIKIFTFIDTIKSNGEIKAINYRYIAANSYIADSIKNLVLNHIDTLPSMVQIEAKFPGGVAAWQKYLERNLNSNVPLNRGAPAGYYTVVVSFLVDALGNISEVRALNNPGYGTAEEAVRVIKNGPPWTPAVLNGRNVIYRQKQSITFQISSH